MLRYGPESFDFSTGFEELHERSYREILAGHGFGIAAFLPALSLVQAIRRAPLVDTPPRHPLCDLPQLPHPFDAAHSY